MIFFRVILENAEIRSAAVSALAKFGALCDELLPNILVLLTRCQMDADDEVRDRATYYKCVLEQKNPNQTSDFLLDGIYYLLSMHTYVFENAISIFIPNVPIYLPILGLHVSLAHLEKALHKYTLSDCINPFDIKKVPKIEDVTTNENSQGRNK